MRWGKRKCVQNPNYICLCLCVRETDAGKIHFSCALAYPLGRRLWQPNENRYRHCQRENIPRAGCEQEELGPGQQDYIHADTNSPLNYPSFHKLAQPWRLLLPAQESCAATRLLLAFGPGDTRWMLSREDNAELWIQEWQTTIKIISYSPAFPFLGCNLAKQLNILKSK